MTQDLFKLKEESLIFVDIETVRSSESLDINSKEFELFSWKMRDRVTDKEPSPEEVQELYKRKAALYPAHSKIVAITCGFVRREVIFLRTFIGEEKDILRNFVDAITKNVGSTLVLWNMSFDIPTIRKRFYANGLEGYLPDAIGNDSMKKPWTLKGIVDLMEVWKGISFSNESMDEVAWMFGLPSPKNELTGAMVSEAYYKGELESIVEYNRLDVKTLINLYRAFVEKPSIQNVVLREEEDEQEKEEQSSIPPLERLYRLNEFSQGIQEELREKIGKKKLTKKDKENLFTILRGAYLHCDFVNQDQDSKKVILVKEAEIEEFIDTLK